MVDDQQIDVAPVVEIGRHDRDGVTLRLHPGGARDVGERPVLVVAEQKQRRRRELMGEQRPVVANLRAGGREVGQPGEEKVDVAVMVDIGERGGARQIWECRHPRCLGDVGEHAAVVPVEAALAVTEHEQIGGLVVVVVGGDRADRHAARRCVRQAGVVGDVGPAGRAIVAHQSLAVGRREEEVEVAVGVVIDRRDAPAERRRERLPTGVGQLIGEKATAKRRAGPGGA